MCDAEKSGGGVVSGIVWFKVHHGTGAESKILYAARMAGVPRAAALGTWLYILEKASSAEERGSPKLLPKLIALDLELTVEQVDAMLAGFREMDMLSDDGQLLKFEKRQGAASSTERVRAYRERKRAAAEPASTEHAAGSVSEVPDVEGLSECWEGLASHPKKAGMQAALPVLRETLSSALNPGAVARSILASHARWCEYWAGDGASFVPALDKWLARGTYLDGPPAPKASTARGGSRNWNQL